MIPDQFTNNETQLKVSDEHTLYVCDWGNSKIKVPFIYLHGGPGAPTSETKKRLFDPLKHRVIFFHQRGVGLSTPFGQLEGNTTQDLIEDIGKLADSLGIDKFILAGGSWGSFLSLAYSIKNPDRVAGMVINGIFLNSKDDIKWIDQGGFRTIFPDAWMKLIDSTPEEFKGEPVIYHMKKAMSDDEQAKQSAYIYSQLELSLIRLDDRPLVEDYANFDPASIRIEINYLLNNCFVDENYIIDNTNKLDMPVWLIQGRYDMVCPAVNAFNLHQKLPNSKLIWTQDGHSMGHEGSNLLSAAHIFLHERFNG
jgi:proline iminopeptidase